VRGGALIIVIAKREHTPGLKAHIYWVREGQT
jgi:hypothetical protein